MRHLVAALAFSALSSSPAQDFQLADVIDSLQRGAVRSNLVASADSVAAFRLDAVASRLRSANAGQVRIATLAQVIAGGKVSLAATNRVNTRGTDLLAQSWFRDDILALLNIAFSVRAQLRAASVPTAEEDGLLAPVTALRRHVRDLANQQGVDRLRRMEIKYGSASPKLNVVEATANFAFQWIPGLRAAKDGSPSRYEFLAAYRTMEISAVKSGTSFPDAQIVSAGQVGLRWYHWNAAWGAGSRLQQLRRPRYASAGLYVIGPADAPLAKLTGVRRRHGAFIGWGSIHVAYVHEAPRRVLVGSDRLLIPHLF